VTTARVYNQDGSYYNVSPITYPARPINGGPPSMVRYRSGYGLEPKYNGWRVLVHVPSGTMFNRHGALLTASREYVPALLKLQGTPFVWLDCEGLSRRHGVARGTLIVFDWVVPEGMMEYVDRRAFLGITFDTAAVGREAQLQQDGVYLAPSFPTVDDNEAVAASVSSTLEGCNQRLGCTFYEGVVAKRNDSFYPIQLRSPETETTDWIKHRFTTS
jgi:ATP-dependent DNA ligase